MTTKKRGRPRLHDPDAPTRDCRICKRHLSVSNFNPNRVRKNGTIEVETRCHDCKRSAKYGTTYDVIESMLADQNFCCAVCKDPLGKIRHIDHCHSTGAVRGILCHGCNVGIGHFRNDPNYLRAAADYLS